MQLVTLADDVYACQQDNRGLGWSNSGLVASGGGLVVDTLYDLALTRRMLDEYARVHPRPPARLVNTHHNGDHCWGNQLLAGASIIAHAGCAARFFEFTPTQAEAIRTMAEPPEHLRDLAQDLAPFDFAGIELTPPDHIIDAELELDLDGIAVRVIPVGPAHTEGDLIVHLPEQRVVFAGDVLFHQCTPIGWEGSTARWIEALELIESLVPEHVVPGHGPVCGVEGVQAMRDYLVYVRDEAHAHWAAEVPVLEACQRMDLGPYASWTEPERLAAVVHRVYRECAGSRWDEPIDTAAVMADVRALRARWGS